MIRNERRASTRALLVASMVALMALSGCLGGEDDPTTEGATSDCVAGDGVLEIHIPEGAGLSDSTLWYEPAAPDLTGIHTICWVNDDSMPHIILGTAGAIDTTPQWVHDAMEMGGGGHVHGGGDDHGAHGGHGDHGGGDTPLLVNVSFGAGERLAMPMPADFSGKIDVHCHPHPWMAATWLIESNITASYPVEVGTVVYQGMLKGHNMTVGNSADVKFPVPGPNVAKVSAKLEWNDADDHFFNTGETLNKKDTFKISIKDPAGTVVKEQTVDSSPVVVEHIIETTWPETADGMGQTSAAAGLAASRADDVSGLGDWTVTVELVSAPGPVTDADGTTKDIQPHFDGKESVTVTFVAINEFAKVLEAGMSPTSGATPAAKAKIEPTVA